MSVKSAAFDVIVAGAGTSGAAAAFNLARRGLSVALLEARPLDQAGARWVNGVAPWAFQRAGIPLPAGAERPNAGDIGGVMMGNSGRWRHVIHPLPVIPTDMRLLTARLQDMARAAGATLYDRVTGIEVLHAGVRPTGVRARQERRNGGVNHLALDARLLVDATGINGALRSQALSLADSCPPVRPEDTCHACMQSREIADVAAARRFLDAESLPTDHMISWFGIDGGFSTVTLTVASDFSRVEVLCGTIADGSHLGGVELLRRTVEKHPWIGRAHFGGAGLIPLRRPYDRLAAPGIALVGDAACQVFPTHGSGVGNGMAAGAILAEAITACNDPGGHEAAWRYQSAFQRELGAIIAAYDPLRRMTQSLTPGEIDLLMGAGFMTPDSIRAALAARMPPFDPALALGGVKGALKAPGLAARFSPVLVKMLALNALYKATPRMGEGVSMNTWSAAARLIAGD